MPTFLRLGRYEGGRTPSGEARVDLRRYVRVGGFVDQERQAPRGRANERRELGGVGRVPENGEFSGSSEGRGLVDDVTDARVCRRSVRSRCTRGVRARTSVDKRPCAHVHGTPHAPSLRKVPPEAVLSTEHVLAWLLVAMHCFNVARCARVSRREELVNRVAVCRFGARQREGGAEEGAKARWAVQIDPRLCVVGSSVRRVCHIHGEVFTGVPREESASG